MATRYLPSGKARSISATARRSTAGHRGHLFMALAMVTIKEATDNNKRTVSTDAP